MRKQKVDNPRYGHHIRIVRRSKEESNNPMKRARQQAEETVIYDGIGRSYTDTTTNGDNGVDTQKRKASIPVRFDEWESKSDEKLYPLDGDLIYVTKGAVEERGRIRDFEPDNNRTVVYWELTRN